MRNGFQIWDTDTHVSPSAETLESYFDATMRARMPDLEQYKRRIGDSTQQGRIVGRHEYRFEGGRAFARPFGAAEPLKGVERVVAKALGTREASEGANDMNVDARVGDMDEEGVDVQVLVPSVPEPPKAWNDHELELGFIRAYHRYVADLCAKYPHRLKGLLHLSQSVIPGCVEEVKRWGDSSWAVGICVRTENDAPLDHPDLEPVWKAVDDAGMAVVFHSTFGASPNFPGRNDLWDNAIVGRAAAHPWGAMRAVGAFMGAGIMDRYQSLRFGTLESGFGWLPFWARRMDSQLDLRPSLAPDMKRRYEETMTSGRFFSSIEMTEGQDMVQLVSDFLGDGVLMYASDYPHHESHFPESTDHFLAWSLTDELRRKLLWDNPIGLYGAP